MNTPLSKAIVDFFMELPLFSRMNPEEVKLVARHMNVVELQPGQVLFQEYEQGNFMCFIESGRLEVLKQLGASQQEVLITTLGRGQSIGEMSVIEDMPRSATIRARDGARLYILSQAAFDLILNRHTNIGIKLLKGIAVLLSNNLRKTSSRLAEYMLPVS